MKSHLKTMKKQTQHLNVFSMLATPVRNALVELGFTEPTAPQVAAIPMILGGRNVLLVAPTGSGKTEAVLLPIFSKLTQQPEKKGIAILYITPLRALNRDMIKRLSFWASKIGFSVQVRHGDTDVKTRRRQAFEPPDMLVTTPETLQAILPGARMRQHLSHVCCVIIDEVHELAESKRGVQLTVALERLSEIVGNDIQRLGLSATVGSPRRVARFLAGTHRPIEILEVPLSKGYQYEVDYPVPQAVDYDLANELRTTPEAAARIRTISDLVKTHTSTLIFVNSRTNAEMLGHKFNQLSPDVAVHHGSLSKEERRRIEDDFKAAILKGIICTSTLELGIDIGHVDLVVQYLSPRQVTSLIQRVGRSGHKLNLISKGILVTAFSDDVLEAVAAVQRANRGQLEPIATHGNALDVLAHQLAGLVLDHRTTKVNAVLEVVRRAYPYRKLSKAKLLDVADYLHYLRELRLEGDILRPTRRTRRYYYENLSMIPDERRYPIVDIVSDRIIGTLGDEFMALRARIGLNFICKGKVWRIVQIEDETSTVYVVPSEDPIGAIPGWDGEMLPVSYDLAQEVGRLRKTIAEELKKGTPKAAARKLAQKLQTGQSTLLLPVEEIEAHLRRHAPLPTNDHVLIEAYDKYVIVHACFGEIVNRTLGCIFDSTLSDHELITGWWNDGYRILIEMPRKAELEDLRKLASLLFTLTDKQVDDAFADYLQARFPFAYKLKFIAERFGALPRGRTMLGKRLAQLPRRFKKTPIYEETLREAMTERVDLSRVKWVMKSVEAGKIKVSTLYCLERPTPLGYHILAKYSDVPELMAPEGVLLSNIERMKKTILARTVSLLCFSCNNWMVDRRIRELPESLTCDKCGAGLLASLRFGQDPKQLSSILERRVQGRELAAGELAELTHARRTADLVLSHGRKALVALQVKGVGPETAFRILGKMHPHDDDFYMDLLKAKIQYLRTRPYWEDHQEEDAARHN